MERFLTTCEFHPWYEHWHRYHFVKNLVKGKKVCDIACGEGYGSALLAEQAESVTGVDIDKATISNAQNKYKNIDNLNYLQADALKTGLSAGQFDVIISFETIEHLREHDQLLDEFQRLLKDDGVLIVSTPDTDVYSGGEDHNHYHLKELSKCEFDDLMAARFDFIKTFGQQFQLLSVIENLDPDDKNGSREQLYVEKGHENEVVNNQYPATYLIKICTNDSKCFEKIESVDWHAFADDHNHLFHHYSEQISRLIKADQHNAELQKTVLKQNAMIQQLKARLGY